MVFNTEKEIVWVAAALKDFEKFPKTAQRKIFDSLTLAAQGEKAGIAKPMKGLGAGVFEVALKYRTDAYRTVYAAQIDDKIWVLHAFKKKSKSGIKTPKKELDLVRQRIRKIKEMAE